MLLRPDRPAHGGQPVSVCFVIENMLAAGTELWLRRLIQGLDRTQVKPCLCLTDGRRDTSRALEPEDCPTLRLELPHLKSLRTWQAMRQFAKFLRAQQVEIVQVHHADPTYLAIPVARWVGVPAVVQTKYDVGYWMLGWDLRMHRWLRRWVDVTVANCEACRGAALAQEHAPPAQVVVIDAGVPLDAWLQIPPPVPDTMQIEPRIGMVANLRPVKDPGCLIDAVGLLQSRFPALRCQLAGQGELESALRRQIHQLRLDSCVTLCGHVADTAEFWREQHLAVLCSLSEGLPHAIIEAMAAGRAVVATRVGGNEELVEHGVTGLLVPPGDPRALATALQELLDDPARAVAMGQLARQRAAERFGEQQMIRRFERLYTSVAAARRTR